MSGIGWRATGGVLALATAGWGAFEVVSVLAHESRTEVTTYDAADVRVVDVASSAGSVTIIGAPERDEITVTARISDGLRPTGERQALVDGRLELRASCPAVGSEWCSVSYTIEVPADVAVDAATDTGRLEVSGIDGPVTVEGDNGSVDLADLAGRLTVSTDNGSIDATGLTSDTVDADTDNGSVLIQFVEPPQTVEATSDNGRVEIVLPDTEGAYALDITTDNGDETRAIRTDPTSPRRITIETDNGDAIVRYRT